MVTSAGPQRADEAAQADALEEADGPVAQRGHGVVAQPEFVQHEVQPRVADDGAQMRPRGKEKSPRVEAVGDELQADPVGRELFAEGDGARAVLRQAKPAGAAGVPSVSVDSTCGAVDDAVVQRQQRAGVALGGAFPAQPPGVVADPVPAGLEAGAEEEYSHAAVLVPVIGGETAQALISWYFVPYWR